LSFSLKESGSGFAGVFDTLRKKYMVAPKTVPWVKMIMIQADVVMGMRFVYGG